MPLKKILLKPGVNRENTRYTTEGGWYDCDKIRFRQGTPEVIGGWSRISANTFLGICRSLWSWVTLSGSVLTGVGTNEKFYVEQGGAYYDITPIQESVTLSNPFTATAGLSTLTVHEVSHGRHAGDYVTYYSATSLGGNMTAAVLNQNYKITAIIDANNYSITTAVTASAGDTGHGGTVYAAYEIPAGTAIGIPYAGWGSGFWSSGTWGFSETSTNALRLWSQSNFGEDLIYGYRGGPMYYWNANLTVLGQNATVTIASPGVVTTSNLAFADGDALTLTTTGSLPTGLVPGQLYYVVNSTGTSYSLALTPGGAAIATSGSQTGDHRVSPRGTALTDFASANQVPTVQNFLLVSDASRFLFAFGANEAGSATQDPMLIRWSDQENPFEWEPLATNQAGSVRLSHGSQIVTAIQTRQEIVVFTDTSVYSLQYLGPPYVWGSQIMGDNISILSQNAAALAGNVVYWMGIDKFYFYDGTVKTLRCDLRQYIYQDINLAQATQVCSGTNEGFNEIWWFYCSAGSTTIDKYVTYNYLEDVWAYGTMARTAWLDSGINQVPIAATYSNNIVSHETGTNDNETGTQTAIHAYILSSEFDIDDGHNFAFIYRILPDLTFRGSDAASPTVTMTLYTLRSSGSGYNVPGSQGGEDHRNVVRTATIPIEQFTGQIYTRVRGRQIAMKVESEQLNTTWQLGAPRIDIRPDGRR
jgi:hypothetical protein